MFSIYFAILLALGSCEPIKEHHSRHRDEKTTLLKDQNSLKSYRNEKIQRMIPAVGGTNVTNIEEYPFMALLLQTHFYEEEGDYWERDSSCGATILNEKYLLTAAHCFKTSEPNSKMKPVEEFTVYAGGLSIDQALVKTNVKRYFIHENFFWYEHDDKLIMFNDIAVVELEHELQFNNKISPVKLPSRLEPTRHENCKILGTGKTSANSTPDPKTSHLKEAKVKIVENTTGSDYPDCSDDAKICNTDKENDSCGGDSGGPLLCNDEQVGIVSYGDGDCRPDGKNVNTRVQYYLDWIEATINGNTKEFK